MNDTREQPVLWTRPYALNLLATLSFFGSFFYLNLSTSGLCRRDWGCPVAGRCDRRRLHRDPIAHAPAGRALLRSRPSRPHDAHRPRQPRRFARADGDRRGHLVAARTPRRPGHWPGDVPDGCRIDGRRTGAAIATRRRGRLLRDGLRDGAGRVPRARCARLQPVGLRRRLPHRRRNRRVHAAARLHLQRARHRSFAPPGPGHNALSAGSDLPHGRVHDRHLRDRRRLHVPAAAQRRAGLRQCRPLLPLPRHPLRDRQARRWTNRRSTRTDGRHGASADLCRRRYGDPSRWRIPPR